MNYLDAPFTRAALERLTVTDSALVAGLRSHVRRLGTFSGTAVVSMNREACIAALLGEPVETFALHAEPRRVAAPDAASMLADALRAAMASQVAPLDEDAVKAIVRESMSNGAFPVDRVEAIVEGMLGKLAPRRFEVTVNGGEAREVTGLRHCQFSQVLTWLASGVPLWLWGGAGAGKTTMARQLAEALGVAPYLVSIDPTATMGKLVGFRNLVSGEYVEGLLYRPYKFGGLVLLDEIDTGDASIIAGLNALLANGHFMFPNGETVEKHAGFRVMAGANTKGTGAVGWFVARVKLDGATLDRFACVELKYDEGLETALCVGGSSASSEWKPALHDEANCAGWVRWVQKVRGQVGNALLVSPRASLNGCAALRAGVPMDEVAEALVFKLATPETKAAILSRCGEAGK